MNTASNILTLINKNQNNEIEIGGSPIFINELTNLQTASEMLGAFAIYKGFSCVLSGMLVNKLNTSTNRVWLTEGYFLINDKVYYFEGNSLDSIGMIYPFAFVKGQETTETRNFKSGQPKDFATSYEYTIKRNFTYTNSTDNYPSDLSSEMIYFDPFTAQRKEFIDFNLSLGSNELRTINSKINLITKTETGNDIIGSALSAINSDNSLKWKYYGYEIVDKDYSIRITNNFTKVGTTLGNDLSVLTKENLPKHTHRSGNLICDFAGEHSHKIGLGIGDPVFDARVEFAQNEAGEAITSDSAGKHKHNLTGETEDGTLDLLNSTSFSNIPFSKNYLGIEWKGYKHNTGVYTTYKFWNRELKYSNM